MNPAQEQPREITVMDRRFVVDVAHDPVFWRTVEDGTWEASTFAFLARSAQAGDLLLDIGAWVGPTALFAAAGGARVIAVEPDPSALARLRANLALNPDLAPLITVIDRALAPDDGPVPLAAPAATGAGASVTSMLQSPHEAGWDAAATAATMTPASLIADIAGDVDVVAKIDIEGGEYVLGPALAPVLRRAHSVQLSLHPRLLTRRKGWVRRVGGRLWAAWRTTQILRLLTGMDWTRVDAVGRLHGATRLRRWVRLGLPVGALKDDWVFVRPDGRETPS